MSTTDTSHDGSYTDHFDAFQEFLDLYYGSNSAETDNRIGQLAANYNGDNTKFVVDYDDLFTYDRDLAYDVLENPSDLLPVFSDALREYDLPIDVSLDNVHVRLGGLDTFPGSRTYEVGQYPLNLKEGEIPSLMVVNGQVTKVTQKQPRFKTAAFECLRCGTITRIPAGGGSYQKPNECQGCERQGPFERSIQMSEMEHVRQARLQLPPEETIGQTTATVEIEYTDDLAELEEEQLRPGDRVKVAGQLDFKNVDEDTGIPDEYIDTNSFEKQETDFENLELHKWEDAILELSERPDIREAIRESILPSHLGDDHIKDAIVLQMFKGVKKVQKDGSETRGDLHVFLIGDPGKGKSQFVSYAAMLSPRSVLANGTTSTEVGLTAAAVQDDFGDGGWTVEGGAVVKANNGLCAIDEFDKLDEDDQTGLNEAMSDQQISVAKGPINGVSLPAETSILAAANPKYGRFDQYESISKQVEFDPTLLSRFDLIFTLTDDVDEEFDTKLAEHLMKDQKTGQKRARDEVIPEELKDEIDPEIELDLLQRYIAYARQNITPVLSDEAEEHIKGFYVTIRQLNGDDEDAPVPITARKIQAITRLAEASARMRLSETITLEDAEHATDLVMTMLEDIGMDPETGEFDADTVETGSTTAQRDRYRTLKQIVDGLAESHDEGAPVDKVLTRMDEQCDVDYDRTRHYIDQLMDKGELYEPRNDHLRTTK